MVDREGRLEAVRRAPVRMAKRRAGVEDERVDTRAPDVGANGRREGADVVEPCKVEPECPGRPGTRARRAPRSTVVPGDCAMRSTATAPSPEVPPVMTTFFMMG